MKSLLLCFALFSVTLLAPWPTFCNLHAAESVSAVTTAPGSAAAGFKGVLVSAPAVLPAEVINPPSDGSQDFLTQVLAAISKFGGLSTLMKITTIILLLIASMKVTFLNGLIWSKLGQWQSAVAPMLGIVAGVLGLFGAGAPVTIASVFAYFLSGVGALGLHELLDDIKALPGIGPTYVAIINAIESALGGAPAPKA